MVRPLLRRRLSLVVALATTQLMALSAGAQTDRAWQGIPGGAWDGIGNWTPAGPSPGFPNAPGDGALNIQLITTATSQATVGGVTVGTIGHDAVNSATSWTITATTAITLNNLGLGAIIRNTNVSSAAGNFLSITGAGGLVLADNLTVTNTGGGTGISNGSIKISAPISGTGNLTLSNVSNNFTTGAGAIILQGANTFVGTTTIAKGETTFNNSGTFSGGQINLGQAASGSASLVSTAAVTVANNITVAAATGGTSLLASNSTAGTYSGIITLNGDVTLANLNSSTRTTSFSNTISGSGGVRVIGPGISLLSKANTFSGATTVDSGTLNAGATGALGGTSGITVNGGGTLLLTSASTDRINNAATMTLSGGTFSLNGQQEGTAGSSGLGALTLTSTSTIDFAIGLTSSLVQFGGVGAHVPNTVLQLTNWDGIIGGGGSERLLFAGVTSDFTTLYTQADVTFNGFAGYQAIQFVDFFEVTPVPEPSTWVAGTLALLAVGYTQLRKHSRAGSRRFKKVGAFASVA